MQKITQENALAISKECDKESYFTSPFFLSNECYFERREGETVLFINDVIDKELRYLYLPKNISKPVEYNVQFAREEDIERLEALGVNIAEKVSYEGEYIYDCVKLSSAEGPEMSGFRHSISHFKRHNSYRIFYEYDPEQVRDFIRWWASTKDVSPYSKFARDVFEWDLSLCLQYPYFSIFPQRNIFVEIDGKLAGFAFTHPLMSNMFVGLMQKVNIKYRGLSHFIYSEKAKLHPGIPYFTIGTACASPGLGAFKDAMRPIQKIPTYLLKVVNE